MIKAQEDLISLYSAHYFRPFCALFREKYVLYVIIYTPFSVLCLDMVIFCISQVLGPFYPKIDQN